MTKEYAIGTDLKRLSVSEDEQGVIIDCAPQPQWGFSQSGCAVQGLGFRGFGFRVLGLGFRV